MSGLLLLGALSGMIIGALAAYARKYSGAVIVTPLIAAPIAYAVVWREAIMGHCFFASSFTSDACVPFRAFVAYTVDHAGEGIIIALSHLIIALATLLALRLVQSCVNMIPKRRPQPNEQDEDADLSGLDIEAQGEPQTG